MGKTDDLLMEYGFEKASDVVEFMTRNNLSKKQIAEIMSQPTGTIRHYVRAHKLGVDIKLSKIRKKQVNPTIDKLIRLQSDISRHIRNLRKSSAAK